MKADGSSEKTPSFSMSLSLGVYFCHSCGVKGNLFTFLRDMGTSRDVIEGQYRLVLDEVSKNRPPPPDPLQPGLFNHTPIDESLLGLFEFFPTNLLDAGFTRDTLFHFEIGYDFTHQRTTYPLRDLEGRLIGISGRAHDGVEPRYKVYTKEYTQWGLPAVNEPDKRILLWNIDKIYPELYFAHKPDYIMLVEGFKACMWAHQAGIRNVVALLGTYLSWEQQWILERLGAPVYLFLDNNFPGRNGTVKAADKLSRRLMVRILEYPDRVLLDPRAQPDSCSPDEVRKQMAIAPSYLNWLLKNVSIVE